MSDIWSRARLLTSTALVSVSLAIVAGAPAAYAAAAAPATTADTSVEEVVVTGSHIPQAGFDTLQPAQSLGKDVLENRGFLNAGDALNELPIFGAAGNNNTGQQSGAVIGEQFVNLYNLGSQRTLVLVDGRRFVSGNAPTVPGGAFSGAAAGQQVDLNDIPNGLIDHIEVIGVGGAPTYGADAIAGTVNIILKKNFEGLNLEGQYGDTLHGGGQSYVGRFLAGANFADGKGNVTISAEYTQQDGLLESNRPNTQPYSQQGSIFGGCGNDPITGKPFGSCLQNNVTVTSITVGGIPTLGGAQANALYPTLAFGGLNIINNYLAGNPAAFPLGIKNAAGQLVSFAPNGTLQPYNIGATTGGLVFNTGGDGLDLSKETSLIAPNKRVLLDSLMHYDFTDHLTGYAETEFSHVEGVQLAGQSGGYESELFNGTQSGSLSFSLNNPFLTPQARGIIAANLGNPTDCATPTAMDCSFVINRSNIDIAPQTATNTLTTYRVVAGFKGDFNVLSRKVNFDASFNYGRSEGTEQSYDINFNNFLNAIDAVVDPATGNIVCNVTLNPPAALPGNKQPNPPQACAPLDLFGQGAASQAAINYVRVRDIATSILTERDAQININGSPFDIWAGPVKLAAGYEFRQETGEFQNDPFSVAGLGFSGPGSNVAGNYESKEYYAEGTIPVVSPSMHIPFVNALEADISYRHIDNSLSGPEDVYTLGGKYHPIEELELRGNFTHSVRAPSIAELFLPQSSVSLFANDPCDPRFIQPKYQANCTAEFSKLGVNLATFNSNIINASVNGFEGGNPNLKDETANSWTAGAVWRPHFIPRLQIAVDWIDIQLASAIESLSVTQVLDACYGASTFPNTYCDAAPRTSTGQIAMGYHIGEQNVAAEAFSGLQFEASYSTDVNAIPFIDKIGMNPSKDYGAVSVHLGGFYEDTHSTSVLGLTTPTRGNVNDPIWKLNGSVNYRIGPFMVYLNGRYVSPGRYDVTLPTNDFQIGGIGAYWVWNTAISYDVTKHITAELTVNNLFDQDPPQNAYLLGGASGLYDYVGQAYVFSIKAKF